MTRPTRGRLRPRGARRLALRGRRRREQPLDGPHFYAARVSVTHALLYGTALSAALSTATGETAATVALQPQERALMDARRIRRALGCPDLLRAAGDTDRCRSRACARARRRSKTSATADARGVDVHAPLAVRQRERRRPAVSAPVVAIDVRRAKASAARLSAQARGIAAELGRAYTVRLTLDSADAQHLVWLDGGTSRGQPARPVLRVTGRAREAATQAILQKLQDSLRASKTLGMLPALVVGGYAMRAVYVDRLEERRRPHPAPALAGLPRFEAPPRPRPAHRRRHRAAPARDAPRPVVVSRTR